MSDGGGAVPGQARGVGRRRRGRGPSRRLGGATVRRPAPAMAARLRQAPATALSLGRPGVRGVGADDRPGPPAREHRPRGRGSGPVPAGRRSGPGRDRVLSRRIRRSRGSRRCWRRSTPPGRALSPGQPVHRPRGRRRLARFVKVLSDEVDDQQEARERWEASVSGALSFAVAEPHGWDEPSRSSWYGVVPGGPVSSAPVRPRRDRARTSGGGVARRTRIGDAAAEQDGTTRQPSWPGPSGGWRGRPLPPRPVGAGCESVRRAHPGPRPTGRAPARPGARGSAPGAVARGRHRTAGSRRLRPVRVGEPEFDLATFVVELRELVTGQPTEELETAVVDGFRAVAGERGRAAARALHRAQAVGQGGPDGLRTASRRRGARGAAARGAPVPTGRLAPP